MYHVHPLLLDGLFLVAQAGASVQLSGFVVQAVERVVLLTGQVSSVPLLSNDRALLSAMGHVQLRIWDPAFVVADIVVYDSVSCQPTLLIEGLRLVPAASPSPTAAFCEVNWMKHDHGHQRAAATFKSDVGKPVSLLATSSVYVIAIPGLDISKQLCTGLENLFDPKPVIEHDLQLLDACFRLDIGRRILIIPLLVQHSLCKCSTEARGASWSRILQLLQLLVRSCLDTKPDARIETTFQVLTSKPLGAMEDKAGAGNWHLHFAALVGMVKASRVEMP